jgi:methyl-accepting chemotaxis protein
MSATTAQSSGELLDTDIGFFHAGKVYASSFVSSLDKSREDVAKSQALSNLLFSGDRVAEKVLQKGTPGEVSTWEIEGHEFAAVVAPMPGNFADKTSGFVVLASLSEGMASVRSAGMMVIWLGLAAILVAITAAVLTARRFIRPLDQIELGVAEVINGNIDYTFKPVGEDFEGLSNSLNVMLARLLGREEPSEDAVEEEEDGGKKAWKAEMMVIEADGGDAPAATVAALAQESEASYYPRLYAEYLAALGKLGQPTDGISVLAFMARLSLAEAGLCEKWECEVVRFLLASAGDRVTFRPVKIA